jgi:hypothetical protein
MRRALAYCLLCLPGFAAALEPLPDSALAKVAGRDGMSFNLSNFAVNGNAVWRYTTPGGDSFSIGNLSASRSDNTAAPFADPYRLDVLPGGPGGADIVNVALPQNALGREVWQVAYDLGVDANGLSVKVGSVLLKDLAYYGGGFQFSTPAVGEGLAFGLSSRFELGSLTLAPNGRDAPGEALVLLDLRVGAATPDGSTSYGASSAPTQPWRIADVASQAGIFNARTDEAGNPSLHVGIGWPDANGAPAGTVQIGNISFNSAAGNVDLGSSRIGSIQLQYLDVKFH